MSEVVLFDLEDGVATVTLNRPEKLNALNGELMEELLPHLQRCWGDAAVRCVVLTGAGRGFCAGGDITMMEARGRVASPPSLEAQILGLRRNMEAPRYLLEMPKPTIAMVNGPVAGAGLSLALACDLRYAAEGAKFLTAFANVGFSGDYGGSYMLTRLVGTAKARELYFLSEAFPAAKALDLGIVNAVFPDDRLRAETTAIARRLAHGPTVAYARIKENMNLALHARYAEALDQEARYQVLTGQTEDHREARRAFLEKRPPTFVGR